MKRMIRLGRPDLHYAVATWDVFREYLTTTEQGEEILNGMLRENHALRNVKPTLI